MLLALLRYSQRRQRAREWANFLEQIEAGSSKNQKRYLTESELALIPVRKLKIEDMRYACCKLKQDPMHAPADTADLPPKKPSVFAYIVSLTGFSLRNQNVSKAKIAILPAVIDSELCFSQLCGENCPVCLGDFEVGEEVRRLPCFHFFHDVCIGPWLVKHSAICPLCNFDVGAIFDEGDGGNIAESATNNSAELHEQLYFAL